MRTPIATRQSAQHVYPQRSSAQHVSAGRLHARASIIRLQHTLGNRGMDRLLQSVAIQTKLTVGPADDQDEREADRVADQVMRMPDPRSEIAVQRAPIGIAHACPECEEQPQRQPATLSPALMQISRPCSVCGAPPRGENAMATVQRQPHSAQGELSTELGEYLANSHGRGQPLAGSVRAYFEPRFGQDFSGVRVHADSRAATAAAEINAYAFTTGANIHFGSGRFQAGTAHGDRLLAHELTHVVQQGRAAAPTPIRRVCQPGPIARVVAASSGCSRFDPSGLVTGLGPFLFKVNCDDFKPGEAAILLTEIGRMPAGTTFEIHGFASIDGPADFNRDLGCARALKAQTILRASGFSSRITGIVNHGGTSGSADIHRSVILTPTVLEPEPPRPQPRANPSVRVWVNSFIPHDKIDGPPGSECFAGDHRGFSNLPSSSSRTHQLVEVTPGRTSPTDSVRRIGATHEVECDTGAVINSATESTSSLTNSAIIGQRSSAQADVFFSADASNPLVRTAPAINLDAEFHLNLATRQCAFNIDHDGFPAYEAYVSADAAPATTVYTYDPRATGEGITALFPPEDKSAVRRVSF